MARWCSVGTSDSLGFTVGTLAGVHSAVAVAGTGSDFGAGAGFRTCFEIPVSDGDLASETYGLDFDDGGSVSVVSLPSESSSAPPSLSLPSTDATESDMWMVCWLVLFPTAGGKVPGSALPDVDAIVFPSFDATAVKESVTFDWFVESGLGSGDIVALPSFDALTVGGDLAVDGLVKSGTVLGGDGFSSSFNGRAVC